MQRQIFRSLVKDGEGDRVRQEIHASAHLLNQMVYRGSLMTTSVFMRGRSLFLYYECINEFVSPSELLPSLLPLLEERKEEFESRHWVPMLDIFHFSVPLSVDHWRRTQPVQERVGRIAFIKPDMVSSYIYYHYMLQEGHTGCDNKYCMIGIDGNLIFYYEELPKTAEERLPGWERKISHLPPEWHLTWQEWMEPHFILSNDSINEERMLRTCELLFGC